MNWLTPPLKWHKHSLTVICDFHLTTGVRVHVTEENLGGLKTFDNALCFSLLDLFVAQSHCTLSTGQYVTVPCPWIHEHVADHYPDARFDIVNRQFTCIHPSCVKRTFDEALSQLAHSAAEAVLSVNSKEK